MPVQPGQTLLHYRLVEKIGEGGMGVVWKALDTSLDRDVALKMLPDSFARDPERLARLEREAKLLASLNHPNIAAIHGFEKSEGVRFLTLELVPGETLAELLREGPLPTEEALRLGHEIAEGLEAACASSIVHRDLKPANIKVTPEGQAKVLDFGLAKALVQESSVADLSQSPTLSVEAVAGIVLGTAPYMSPEQARGKAMDSRSDIWAFGCVLYEMLTGRRAFPGETVTDVLAAIIEREPDWSALPKKLDARVRELLQRCLTKDPHQRLQHIGDGRIQIAELISMPAEAGTAGNGGARIGSRERIAWIIAASLLVIVAGLTYAVIDARRGTTAVRTELRLAAGLPSGVYYPIGVGIARLVERELPNVAIEVVVTDGAFENALLLDLGEVDLALVQNDIAFNSVKTELVLGHRSPEIVGVAVLYEEIAQIVVAKDAGIGAIHDLEGQPVSLGPPSGGGRFSSGIMLSHFGVHVREPDWRGWDNWKEETEGLLDGSLVGTINWSAIPAPFLEEAFRLDKAELLSIDRKSLDGLRVNHPFMVPVTIPANVYPNQNAPVSTIAVKAMIAASTSVEPDLVEDILRVIFTNIPDLIAHHPRASDISPDSAFRLEDGMAIDLHPGAERFFRSLSAGS